MQAGLLEGYMEVSEHLPSPFNLAIICTILAGFSIYGLYRIVTNPLWFRTRLNRLDLLDVELKRAGSGNPLWGRFLDEYRKTLLLQELCGIDAKGEKRDALLRAYLDHPNKFSLPMLRGASEHLGVERGALVLKNYLMARINQWIFRLFGVVSFIAFVALGAYLPSSDNLVDFSTRIAYMVFFYCAGLLFVIQSMTLDWARGVVDSATVGK